MDTNARRAGSAKPPADFYEIQKRQKIRSLWIIGLLAVFYMVALGLILFLFWFLVAAAAGRFPFAEPRFWRTFLLIDVSASVLVALFHYLDARRFGAAFILKRLGAVPPDRSDRYHLLLANAVEEIRLAAGIAKARAAVLPDHAVNSLAVVEKDGTAVIALTEGMLADFTRDEIESVAAHELGHVARGDAVYMTVICSLVNFFERLRQAFEPDVESPPSGGAPGRSGGNLLSAVAGVSWLIMRFLSVVISRERELLADAAAVELGRSPASLGRAIYKAAVTNSFIGDFNMTYSPLFIVDPESRRTDGGGRALRWTRTHPPLETRLRKLADMAHVTPRALIEQVESARRERERARVMVSASGERPMSEAEPLPAPPDAAADGERIWWMRDAREQWQGPFSLAELISRRGFSPHIRVRNEREGLQARAREFPQIRETLERLSKAKPASAEAGRCPRCRIPLAQTTYEGVPILACRKCSGKLIAQDRMDRVLARREVGFSKSLVEKADAFLEAVRVDPSRRKRAAESVLSPKAACPECGYQMAPRPYNYQYFIPVDRCLSCNRIWFDADELEILQIIVERVRESRAGKP